MELSNTDKKEIINLIKSDYGRSGGKCVTNAIYGVTNKDEVYKEVEKLNYSECAMGSGYGVHTNLDSNIRKHIGVTLEQLLRTVLSKKLDTAERYKLCYLRLLRSAHTVGRLDRALEICSKITGNNNESIDNMYLLSRFSDAEQVYNTWKADKVYKELSDAQKMADDILNRVLNCSPREALIHREAKEIVSLCLNRSVVYFTSECKVRDFGVVLTVSGGNIHGGEVDVVTKDSIVDIKVKEHFTVYDVLQVLTYARIMKLNKHKLYKGIKYVKLINPFTNKVRTYTIKSIPKEIWELIDDNIICTYKQLSLFDKTVDAMGDLSKIFD